MKMNMTRSVMTSVAARVGTNEGQLLADRIISLRCGI
jgi:hypothetical protein